MYYVFLHVHVGQKINEYYKIIFFHSALLNYNYLHYYLLLNVYRLKAEVLVYSLVDSCKKTSFTSLLEHSRLMQMTRLCCAVFNSEL